MCKLCFPFFKNTKTKNVAFARCCSSDKTESDEEKEFFSLATELRSRRQTPRPSVAQSDDGNLDQHVNVGFSDDATPYDLVIGRNSDPTLSYHKNYSDDLVTFMSRPIRIFNKNWDVNESPRYYQVINPWELFLNNPRVRNKIETFKLLHGTLKIKIMVNGSPFHFGRMFFGVRPSRFNNNTTTFTPPSSHIITNYRNDFASGVKTGFPLQTLYSQRPHVFIDPSTNQPQVITWPFFASVDWLDTGRPTIVDRMGRLEIWEINQLRHANGATDGVEISIYAWMEDVVFAGLSGQDVSVAQSDDQSGVTVGSTTMLNPTGDSRGDSKDSEVKAPSTSVAASILSSIPMIGMHSKSSQISNGNSVISNLFGFNKMPLLSDYFFARPTMIGNLANFNGKDPIHKLALDVKQELTIDPRTVGLGGKDEMSFSAITSVESYLDTFTWFSDPSISLLYSIVVHPKVAPRFAPTPATLSPINIDCPTSVSFVTTPFRHWTGSLRYRFQIVASQMHRGRLLFVYEPNINIVGNIVDTNNRYARIVDITKERDVTFEINWTQAEAYRRTDLPTTGGWAISGNVGSFDPSIDRFCNGRISVFVLNTLASPSNIEDVSVNVFISAGDNFQVQNPNDDIAYLSYSPQALGNLKGPPSNAQSDGGYASVITKDENSSNQENAIVLNGMHHPIHKDLSSVYFGENIVSFRSLLRRYTYYRTLRAISVGIDPEALYLHTFRLYNVPLGPGRSYGSSTGGLIAIGGSDYNAVAMTYIRYVMSAYVGFRGAIRHKFQLMTSIQPHAFMKVCRNASKILSETEESVNTIQRGQTVATVSRRALNRAILLASMAGASQTSSQVNAALEVEFPFLSEYRFAEVSEPPTTVGANNSVLLDLNHYVAVAYLRQQTATTESPILGFDIHTAIGDDFNLFYYIGAPPIMATDALTYQ